MMLFAYTPGQGEPIGMMLALLLFAFAWLIIARA